MGRGRGQTSAAVGAEDAHRFFDEKVAGVRASTDDAPPPTFSSTPQSCRLRDFRRLTTEDVVAAVHLLRGGGLKRIQSVYFSNNISRPQGGGGSGGGGLSPGYALPMECEQMFSGSLTFLHCAIVHLLPVLHSMLNIYSLFCSVSG